MGLGTYFSWLIMKLLFLMLSLGLLIFFYPVVSFNQHYRTKIIDLAQSPRQKVAIVFGASVKRGRPSNALKQRLLVAVELYRAGKVERFIFSGDGKDPGYNEPVAMQKFAVQMGIPSTKITLDPLGLNTSATCKRAKVVYGIDSAILITQAYHLPRALYYCENFQLKVMGVPAKHWLGVSYPLGLIREALAVNLIWWQTHTKSFTSLREL